MHLAKQKECTACMACVDVCAHNALRAQIDKNGFYSIVVSSALCVNCGACTNVCPIINPITAKCRESNPYAAWSNDLEQRVRSASGGIFAAIATVVLKQGGIVYGAAIDGFDIVHKRINEIEELPMLQGSKYQQSNLTGIYKQVRKDLRDKKIVLFTGLGCQIHGLLSFLKGTNQDRLYTIDAICGGLSTMLPMIQLKESGAYKGINSFRDKEKGWQSKGFRYSLKMIKQDDSLADLGLDNMVLNTFSSKLLKRSSCLDCKFTGFHRISDITVGDFWGTDKFKEQHDNGLSVIAIHSERILPLLKTADIQLETIKWDEFTGSNPNYYWTKQPLIRYFISRRIALSAMRKNKNEIAARLMCPYSWAGLMMRVYLKINTFQRSIFYINKISKIR